MWRQSECTGEKSMHLAQKSGSFFYTYTQCTKFSCNFLFQGNLGNIREIFVFPLPSRRGEKEERAAPFQIYYISLRWGAAPTRRAHRGIQTPSLCEYRLAVEFGLAINFIIAHLNSSVARFRISLSSGIRMFARESETREMHWIHSFSGARGREYQIKVKGVG